MRGFYYSRKRSESSRRRFWDSRTRCWCSRRFWHWRTRSGSSRRRFGDLKRGLDVQGGFSTQEEGLTVRGRGFRNRGRGLGALWGGFVVPQGLYSSGSMFLRFYVPQGLYCSGSMVLRVYVPPIDFSYLEEQRTLKQIKGISIPQVQCPSGSIFLLEEHWTL